MIYEFVKMKIDRSYLPIEILEKMEWRNEERIITRKCLIVYISVCHEFIAFVTSLASVCFFRPNNA